MNMQFRNTTGEDIYLADLGDLLIPSNQAVDVSNEDSDHIRSCPDIMSLIDSGDIVVTDGVSDQDPQSAAVMLEDRNPLSLAGSLFSVVYTDEGSCEAEFLSLGGDGGNGSHNTHYIFPWKARLVAMSFSNRDASRDGEIHVLKCKASSRQVEDYPMFTMPFVNCRTAVTTEMSADIIYQAGERMAVYIKSDRVRKASVTLHFQVIDHYHQTISENYSGSTSTPSFIWDND